MKSPDYPNKQSDKQSAKEIDKFPHPLFSNKCVFTGCSLDRNNFELMDLLQGPDTLAPGRSRNIP